MGNYNSEYESYYNSMINEKKGKNYVSSKKTFDGRGRKSIGLNFISNLFNKQRIFKRVVQELVGGLLLFIILIFCKSNVLEQSKTVYNYSKKVVHQNLDIKELQNDLGKVKNLKLDNFQTKVNDFVKDIKISLN